MSGNYRHTQTSGWLRLALILPAVLLFALGLAAGQGSSLLPGLPIFLIAGVLAPIGWAFSSLSIEVTPTQLVWFFGPGVWRKAVARSDIRRTTVVRNKWWWGWGIHLTPRGWLYNVGGLEAVEIALADGRMLRLGSDECEALVQALQGH
jgi:hypothetical protein